MDCSGANFGSLILGERSQSSALPPCQEALRTLLLQRIFRIFISYYMQDTLDMQAGLDHFLKITENS